MCPGGRRVFSGCTCHQQAKSWKLRSATRLSRLWEHQGKQKEAHTPVTPIYVGFSEGFETADLQEAKALPEAVHSCSRDCCDV